MALVRFFMASLAALVATLSVTVVFAAGPTWEQELIGARAARVMPLALSADGRTRLHVDSHHVLHRVLLADARQDRQVALPFAVRAIAASRTGQKVALRTDAGCVGLVDFGAAGATSAPTLRWLDASFPEARGAPATTPEPWSDTAPGLCASRNDASSSDLGWPTLALSVDGRLLATEFEVVDTETHRLVASLRGAPMRLRFIDAGRRLLVQGVVTSSGYESVPDGLSEVSLAVWDLASGALVDVLRRRMGELGDASLDVALPTDAAVAWYVDEPATWTGEGRRELVLHRWEPTGCGGADAGILIDGSPRWLREVVVDPLGRWVATRRDVGVRDDWAPELVVQAVADGRVLVRRPGGDFAGLVSTPDGTRLLALALSDEIPTAADGVRASGDTVVDIPIDVSGLRALSVAARASCGIDGAPAQSLVVARAVHHLAPLWTRLLPKAVPPGEAKADEASAKAPACTFAATFDIDGNGGVFFRADGTLWVDRFATLAQLDAATGKSLRTLATPRSPQVCSAVAPRHDGFFNIQGDTLTWRPLEAGTAPRRVIEQRPGWSAMEVSSLDRAVRVAWVAREGVVKPDAQGNVDNFAMAIYDTAGRRVSQYVGSYESYDFAGDSGEPLYGPAFMPPCTDAAGPIVDGPAWQVDAFGSLRARACGAAGAPARTLMWTDTDIVPRPGSPRDAISRPDAVAIDGAIAVMADEQRLRVFDVEQRRELGSVAWTGARPRSIALSAAQSLVVIQTWAGDDAHVVLTAYRFR